MAEVDVLIDKL